MRKYAPTTSATALNWCPIRNAVSGALFDIARTMRIPMIEQIRPKEARARGRNISACCPFVGSVVSAAMPYSAPIAIVEAIAIVAIMEPQYDSKISDPMPATSPTLSPTLSAITPGFLGSSSGMPASILPTRSAPTSALLVKIPPPTREKSATTEPPMPNPWIACSASGSPPKNQ